MTVKDLKKDPATLTMVVTAEFHRTGRTGLAAVGRPSSARALVGPTRLPRHRGRSRPRAGRDRELLHDRTRR
jgi:hypothetical protein